MNKALRQLISGSDLRSSLRPLRGGVRRSNLRLRRGDVHHNRLRNRRLRHSNRNLLR